MVNFAYPKPETPEFSWLACGQKDISSRNHETRYTPFRVLVMILFRTTSRKNI
jgi:hypothetical protein